MASNNTNKTSTPPVEKEHLFELVDSNITAEFELDGKNYEVSNFSISFSKEVDHKGKPQTATKGGQFSLTLTHSAPESIAYWATREYSKKNGAILFKSNSSGTILEIKFENAYCVHFTMSVDSFSGTQVTLVVAPEKVIMSNTTHDNKWRN